MRDSSTPTCNLYLQEDVRWIGLIFIEYSRRHVDMAKAKELLGQIPSGQQFYGDVAPGLN